MTNLIIQVSKYLIIILMALYTLQCFTVFGKRDEESRQYLFMRQNMLMFFMHFVAFMVLYLEMAKTTLLIFYGAQVIYLAAVLLLFTKLYPRASRLLINNMCMLISIGFIMITRISYSQSTKQFKIAVVASVIALLVPVLIRKLRFITKMYWLYVLVGLGLLALVAIAARSTYGAKLSFDFGFFSIQPSEFVKIIYVFAVAGLLSHARDFKRIAVATGLAALHVLILVLSKDLGSALIFFITYLVMIFVSTRNPFYTLAGLLAGSGAAVGAYFLFNHVRVRVQAWQDPFRDYQGGGYQICQSLFAISAGGWFGTGLCQGSPEAIPFVEQDFMFSAIAEELGSIFGICLLLVCMSCFVMFVNISMQLTNRFYRLVAVGLGTTYAAQIFLTVGGGIKLIPMTGVTLPFVSYGGSSMLSTLIMFSIVQGLYMLQRDEEAKNEAQDQQRYGINAQQMRWPEGGYAEGSYRDGYAEGPYRDNDYAGRPYRDDDYSGRSYRDDDYVGRRPYRDGYEEEPYRDDDYAEGSYTDDGYEEMPYTEQTYEDGQGPEYGGYDGYDDGTRYDYYGEEETYREYGKEDKEEDTYWR
ncbi:MAG: FtsW/RodA/SpoVE family cell cycle protein [Lachnospiraceae bacterium]|nr:FtsW/RodA/SpoVE family cell cycle protein [Lachnospiraceae bacterium]